MFSRKRWGHVLVLAALGFASITTAVQAQISFSSPKNVSNNTDFSFTPQVAVDSAGHIYIYMVWEDDTSTNSNILFSLSTDGGATFSTPKSLSNSKGNSFNPRITVDSLNNIDVVWQDDTPGPTDVFFSHSTDAGTTFSAPVNLSNDPAYSANPHVAADSAGNVFVVWENDSGALGILFSRSLDGGSTFSAPAMLSTNTGGSVSPQMAVDGAGNVNVVWEDDVLSSSDISFARSQDHGASFSAPKSLSHDVGNSNSAQLAVDLSGNVNVVWQNDSPGNFDIFYTRSSDGQNFSALLNLSNNPGSANNPQVATDLGGNINVVWSENVPPSSNPDIFFSRSSNAGASFSAPTNVSSDAGASISPSLAVDSAGNINVAWDDATPGNRDIFFSRSTDAGVTFFSTPQNLSMDPGISSVPQIVADKNGSLNVVWQDSTGGVSQILFSRFTAAVVNHPPVASAGPDQTIQATSQNATPVTLDGSKSSDPNNGTLTYVWTDQSNSVVGSTAIVQLSLLPGSYAFTLTVTDPGNLSNSAMMHVTITAPVNHPPVASAGASQTLGCTSQIGAQVMLNGSASSDPDGDTLSFVWKDAAGNLVGTTAIVPTVVPLGAHSFTLTVTDPGGLSSSASVLITVQDTTSPSLSVSLSPNVLQPPNHKLIPVTATISASDACSANVAVRLVSIVSNEPDNGTGDGDQPNDIQSVSGGSIPFGTDVRSFLLRAERSGSGTGRVYTVTYSATDASGNSTSSSAAVYVPLGSTDPSSVGTAPSGSGDDDDHRHSKKNKHHDKDKDKDHDHDDDKNHDHH